jgi:hypothetical protein
MSRTVLARTARAHRPVALLLAVATTLAALLVPTGGAALAAAPPGGAALAAAPPGAAPPGTAPPGTAPPGAALPAAALPPDATGPLGPAAAPGAKALCKYREHKTVTSKWGGSRYIIVNDNFAGRRECLTNRRDQPNFVVTKSRAHSNGPEVQAYPFILAGCSWGVCSPKLPLPAKVKNLRVATSSWYTTLHTRGRWDAAYDLWFGHSRSAKNGQAKGAELMIWLKAGEFPVGRGVPVVKIGKRRWHFHHWVADHSGVRWNYIQFRAVRSTNHLKHFNLLAVIKRAEKMGLVRRSWWLINVEAGFEIWTGGNQLATRWFSASVKTKASLKRK